MELVEIALGSSSFQRLGAQKDAQKVRDESLRLPLLRR
jgi:hypothetical protein